MKKQPVAAPVPDDSRDNEALQRLLHDLEVHQLELEVQNRELREAQWQLEESRGRLADLYDFAPIAYLTFDPMGRILEANLTAAALFGVERGNLIGRFLSPLVERRDRRVMRDHIRRCFGERIRVENEINFTVRGRPGVTAQVVSAPFVEADGTVTGCKTTLTDITALRRGQEQLQLLAQAAGKLASSFDYRSMLKEVAQLLVPTIADVCIVDLVQSDGKLERLEVACASPATAARLTPLWVPEVSADEAGASAWVMRLRQPIMLDEGLQASPGRDLSFAHDPLIEASQATSMMLVPLVIRDKALGVFTFIVAESGRRYTGETLATARDLAVHAATAIENARLYEAAQQAIRMREDLLAFVSHDLRNPLTGVQLTTELLIRRRGGPERRRGWGQLERVRRSTEQMQRMIDDLLDMATVEAGRLKIRLASHDVKALCAEALAAIGPLAMEKQITLRFEMGGGACVVRCDRERVLQVLSNLLGNALKFTPAGGMVTLSVERTPDRAMFFVRDTGPGVPEALRDRIFDRFWQADESSGKGRGLGLYIAKSLVQAQGGSIWVDAAPEGGASFSFTLPLAPSSGRPDAATLDQEAAAEAAEAAR